MPRPKVPTAAIQPAQGKRKIFDESEDQIAVAGPSSGQGFRLGFSQGSDGSDEEDEGDYEDMSDDEEEDDDDDDEAPEAVAVGAAKKGIKSQEDEIAHTQRAKREAAVARSKAIADAKAALKAGAKKPTVNKPNPAGTKRKLASAGADEAEKNDGDDADAKRLRKRMEAAMAAGDDESDDEEEDGEGSEAGSFHTVSDGEEDEEDEDDGEGEDGEGSFHSDSEDEDEEEDEEDDGAESDSSETLKDGPLSAKERAMRAQMQAMMEAAEARSGVSVPAKSKKAASTTVKPEAAAKSALKSGKRRAEAEPVEEEEDNFDLAPLSGFGRPLSAKVLKAAAAEEADTEVRRQEAARIRKEQQRETKRDKRKRRKVDKEEIVRDIGNGKHLQLLQPDLPAPGTGLPPIMPARSSKPAGAQSRTNFFKTAMKSSGAIPGRGLVDGRKRVGIMGGRRA